MEKPKLYIAGPMTGYEGYNYPAFAAAQQQLVEAGYETESPHQHELPPDGEEVVWADYMRRDIPMLLTCRGVAVLDGWEASRGANLEVHIARTLDMPVQHISDWLDAA